MEHANIILYRLNIISTPPSGENQNWYFWNWQYMICFEGCSLFWYFLFYAFYIIYNTLVRVFRSSVVEKVCSFMDLSSFGNRAKNFIQTVHKFQIIFLFDGTTFQREPTIHTVIVIEENSEENHIRSNSRSAFFYLGSSGRFSSLLYCFHELLTCWGVEREQ